MLIEGGQGFAADAQSGPPGDITLRNDLVHNFLDLGTGNSEAQAFHTGVVGKGADLHGVDADDLPVAVDQRPAGVAGVQGGVGLDQGHGAAVHVHVPVDGGDDAVGVGAPEGRPQGIADGNHRIAHPQCGGIPKLGGGQVGAVDAQHRQVGNVVATNQPGREAAVIGELHGNDVGILYHMGIGHDISVSGEHHPGAGGRTAAALTGDGHHGGDIEGVDILQGHAAALGNIVNALGRRLQIHGSVGGGSGNSRRGLSGHGLLRRLLGWFRDEGDGQLLMLLLIGFQLPEQADIQKAQHGDDAAQENNQNQHQRQQGAPAFWRVCWPGAVYAVVPVGIVVISFAHRVPR